MKVFIGTPPIETDILRNATVYVIHEEYYNTYIVCETPEEQHKFLSLLEAYKNGDSDKELKALEKLQRFVDEQVGDNNSVFYVEGAQLAYAEGTWRVSRISLEEDNAEHASWTYPKEDADNAPPDWNRIDNEPPSGSIQEESGGVTLCF